MGAMIVCGDRVVYRGERSPDYPDAAYRGTVVAVEDRMVTVRWDDCAEWDGEECAVSEGYVMRDAGQPGDRTEG
jgi:hypothetical protein